MLRELREAWSTGRLRHAVAFLDVPAFLDQDKPSIGDEDERRLAFLDNGAPNTDMRAQRLHDALLASFTLPALVDSVKTILVQSAGPNSGERVLDLRADGTSTDADFAGAARAEGMNAVFAQKDQSILASVPDLQRELADWRGPMPNLGIVKEMVRFCLEHDVTLTLIIGSSHADVLEIYRRAGLWPRVELLKQQIAGIVAEANSDKIDAWDFFEYATYTTEQIPPANDLVTGLRWFWEPVHFKLALGDAMLRRVFLGTPADYGAPLTAATVDARNQLVREQQRGFIDWRLACETAARDKCSLPDHMLAEGPR